MAPELTLSDNPLDATLARRPLPSAAVQHSLQRLLDRGFCGVEDVDWASLGVDFGAISRAMDALKAAGWPPVYVFMYDEVWRACEALFDIIAPLLQDDELVLEASVGLT